LVKDATLKRLFFWVVLIVVAITVLFSAYVRLAPTDPSAWQVAVASPDPATPGPCTHKITIVPKGARATCLLPGAPADVLAKLAASALASPRTATIASDATRTTWVSRSLVMGYPDYITAEVAPAPEGTRLDIFSRQRFGQGDMGVNAARLKAWLAQF
jgi:hypothetical protein